MIASVIAFGAKLIRLGERGADIADVIAMMFTILACLWAVLGRRSAGDGHGRRLIPLPSVPRRVVVLLAAIAVTSSAGWLGRGAADPTTTAVKGCPAAAVLRVLTGPEQVRPTRELLAAYRGATVEHGCALVEPFVLTAPASEARSALATGWTGSVRTRFGPLPDLWLTDAANLAAELAATPAERVRAIDDIAWSPVLMAPPTAAIAERPELGWYRATTTWAELDDLRRTEGWTLLRASPAASAGALAATASLYTNGGDRALEHAIGAALDAAGYPLGDETELLCHHRRHSPDGPVTALAVTEQAMLRFNRGDVLNERCGAGPPRAGGDELLGLYPTDGVAVTHRAVRFHWTHGRPRSAADDFVAWLRGPDGAAELWNVGLRPEHGRPEAGNGALGPVPRPGRLDAAAERETEQRYRLARRTLRVLIAVDASGSMAARPGPSSRFQLAAQGVSRALAQVTARDEVGLWVFPAGPAPYRELAGLGRPDEDLGGVTRRDLAVRELAGVTPAGQTPLVTTVEAGLTALGPGDETQVSAMVVLTDGRATDGVALPADRAAAAGVRLFVVAAGEASCADAALRDATTATGGVCVDADPAGLGTTLTTLLANLWGEDG